MKLSPEEIDKAIKEKEKHWASLTEEEKRKEYFNALNIIRKALLNTDFLE